MSRHRHNIHDHISFCYVELLHKTLHDSRILQLCLLDGLVVRELAVGEGRKEAERARVGARAGVCQFAWLSVSNSRCHMADDLRDCVVEVDAHDEPESKL